MNMPVAVTLCMTKPKNAFDKMKQGARELQQRVKKDMLHKKANDPMVYAGIYRVTLVRVPEDCTLKGVVYIGQTTRCGFESAQEAVKARWKEEIKTAAKVNASTGFIAALRLFGADAFDWELLEMKCAPQTEAQVWANEREIALIAKYGGTLRDMEPPVFIQQTFNLTTGGRGNLWPSIEARCAKIWRRFQQELELFVSQNGTSYVPWNYINLQNGYLLGSTVTRVRSGDMLHGRPDEADRRAWLERLPKWTWKARETSEFKNRQAEIGKKLAERQEAADPGYHSRKFKAILAKASPETLQKWKDARCDACNRPEVKEAMKKKAKQRDARKEAANPGYASRRAKNMWKNMTPEKLQAYKKSLSDAQNRPDVKEANRKRGRDQVKALEMADPGCMSRRSKALWENKEIRAKIKASHEATYAKRRRARLEEGRLAADEELPKRVSDRTKFTYYRFKGDIVWWNGFEYKSFGPLCDPEPVRHSSAAYGAQHSSSDEE
jgi:hypothetical protein